MITGQKIEPMHFHSWHVDEFHAWLNDYVQNQFTATKATSLGLTDVRAQLLIYDAGMSAAGIDDAAYPETAQMDARFAQLYELAQHLIVATEYFAFDASATASEKAGATAVYAPVQHLRALSREAIDGCLDTVNDVCLALLATPANLSAFRQLEAVQNMQTIKNEIVALASARDAAKRYRSEPHSGYDIKQEAEQFVQEHFTGLEFLSAHGTTAQKTDANELINLLNNKQSAMKTLLAARDTRNAKKKKPGEQPSDDNSGDNSGDNGDDSSGGSSGGHKPHDPNKPSTDPNRPEGPDPNEDGGDDNNTGGDDNNSGGDSGNTGGSDDNNGGNSGGSDNNNDKPSGDKPPNPESPD